VVVYFHNEVATSFYRSCAVGMMKDFEHFWEAFHHFKGLFRVHGLYVGPTVWLEASFVVLGLYRDFSFLVSPSFVIQA
jgi:hypothetical protein